jgi:hypothetical protein
MKCEFCGKKLRKGFEYLPNALTFGYAPMHEQCVIDAWNAIAGRPATNDNYASLQAQFYVHFCGDLPDLEELEAK